MPLPTDTNAYVTCRLNIILSSPINYDVQTATDELFRYLSDNPQMAERILPKGKCAVAIDADNECIADLVSHFLPPEWQQRITVATYDRFTDVIRVVQNTLPALLIIHSNLILLGAEGAISACVALSPGTRYLLLTAWSTEVIEQLHKSYAPLRVSLNTLAMPFSRDQFIEAISLAAGDVLPKTKDRH
jgi:hypothetical protein